jgi:hypothetical protein
LVALFATNEVEGSAVVSSPSPLQLNRDGSIESYFFFTFVFVLFTFADLAAFFPACFAAGVFAALSAARFFSMSA